VKLVCPLEHHLIDRIEGRSICVRVDATQDIAAAAADARQRNTLVCVICDLSEPLADIAVEDGWHGVPIALAVPSVGRFRDIARKTETLRKLNLRVYLPAEAHSGARILASLGIPVCVDFGTSADWDALADLMTYALLGVVPHAPIEPFQTIADGYRQAGRCDEWGRVLFDDPSRFLHLDAEGRIALSRRDLLAGRFVTSDLSQLDGPEVRRAVEQRMQAWRTVFAGDHFCARCQAWRICRGRLCDGKAAPDGCDAFFAEMADVIERRHDKSGMRAEKWRP
jgi:hypothetical protein